MAHSSEAAASTSVRAVLSGGRAWLAALLAAALVAIGWISVERYLSLKRELTDAALARRAAVASLAAAALSEKLDRLIDVGVALATRVRFRDLVATGRWIEAVEILRRVPQDFAYVDRVLLADARGTLMADSPPLPDVRGRNFAQRDWFKGVSRDWRPYISELYVRAAAPQLEVVAVAVPVRAADDAVAGILVLQIRLETYFDWAYRVDATPGARLAFVDRSGRIAFDSTRPAGAPLLAAADRVAVRAAPGAEIVRAASTGAEAVLGRATASHGWQVRSELPATSAFVARDRLLHQLHVDAILIALLASAGIAFGAQALIARRQARAESAHRAELERAHDSLLRQAERLRILHEVDRAIVAQRSPVDIAGAVIQPVRALLGVPRAIVNVFDLAAGEVEWIAAAGRKRTRIGPGVRYSLRLMGDLEGLRRGEPQRIDVGALPAGAEVDALRRSGVHYYLAVPMAAGGELIGALSFGGERDKFSPEQVRIAQEIATQIAIAMAQARLFERVRRHAAELEQRVAERTTELLAANRELEAFSYSVSHDLRAPLRAVDGFAQALVEDHAGELSAEARRKLGVVRDETRRMGVLIDELLQFSRLSRQELRHVEVDMTALARKSFDALLAQRAGREVEVQIGALAAARGDPVLLGQVWMNLLCNALKFTARCERPRIEVGSAGDAAEHVYSVRDNGAGFDPRYKAKLFGVFQRLHDAGEYPGTGVGLALVQRIVARHGGQVWADGAPGAGATFHFSLPAQPSHGAV